MKVNIHFMLCILFCKSQSSVDHSQVNKEELQFQKFHLFRNTLKIFFIKRYNEYLFGFFTVKYSSVVTCICSLFC